MNTVLQSSNLLHQCFILNPRSDLGYHETVMRIFADAAIKHGVLFLDNSYQTEILWLLA